ncbi:MAG: hypothetical protein ACRDQ9_20630 [Pseudonocardiaceae bacterium]
MILEPAAGFGRHHLRELHRDPEAQSQLDAGLWELDNQRCTMTTGLGYTYAGAGCRATADPTPYTGR